ncbi:MAG: HEPN domain-containing protein [Spirochaetales bacterium]|nr:HEPN domain-containing protein [Spirochaetales bacterium]
MAARWQDWWQQAQIDLQKAQLDLEHQYFEWACFTAQQAAEKAVKSIYYLWNGEARGHGVAALLQGLGKAPGRSVSIDPEVLDAARELDQFYIPTRYPNGLPEGLPHRAFSIVQAERAIQHGRFVQEWCEKQIQPSGGG